MTNLQKYLRSSLIRLQSAIVVFALVVLPLAAPFSASATADGCVAPSDSTYGNGVHHPVGSDASLFTYNCGSGLWVSPHYSYDPSTGVYTATDPIVYNYNPASGAYDYTVWDYSAATGSYVAVTQSTANPPAGATVVGAPTPDPSGNTISNTGAGSNNNISDNGGATDGSSINNTGPNSNNNINGSAANSTTGNNSTGTTVNNTLTANANTGDGLVLSNTTAGNAASGNATDVANVMNLLQSSSNALGGNAVTFVANIDGNVNGDLMLDPSTLSNIQPASTGTTNTTINNTSNATLTNNINLNANSGNATVADNTSGGNATSGAAKTIANVVNLINSAVTSGKSFLGVININGDFNGDILMPSNFIDQLLAANVPTVNVITNTGPSSANTITDNAGSNTTVNNQNNQGITNNVNTKATTGTAHVSDNTSAGSATSGTANTSITAFNLTGSNVIGKNDMLVFVNVVGGKWVGLIVNAPPGTTAAELGGGIVTNGNNGNTAVNNNSNQQITNNINLNSQSGNASVNHNTKGGNATSGNADDAVNLLNVQNSSLALSNWFGILFINVFGTWNGSFGINTSAGDPIVNGGGSLPGSFSGTPAFGFSPSPNHSAAGTSGGQGTGSFYTNFASVAGSVNTSAASTSGSILAAIKNKAAAPHSATYTPSHVNWLLVIGSGGILAIYLLGERFYIVRNRSSLSV